MATPSIEDLLRSVSSDNQKVASAGPDRSVQPSGTREAFQSALRDTVNTFQGTKTASDQTGAPATPGSDLVKMAQEIVAMDRDGEIKHAALVGTAMADAFVSRMGQYEGAAAVVGSQKVASDATELAKFASENPELFRLAVGQGYQDANSLMNKVGQDVYNQAYADEVKEIQKTAALHFLAGFNSIAQVLDRQA